MEPVRSPRNPKVAEADRLSRARDRRATGLTLLEGPNLLAEAVNARVVVKRVFALATDRAAADAARAAGAELVVVEQAALDRLASTDTPRGPVSVVEVPAPGDSSRDAVVVSVTDPGNAGTIVRTAAAFGFDVVTTPGAVDLWAPKVLRAGAGAHFRTVMASGTSARRIATVVTGGVEPDRLGEVLDPAQPYAVLVGSEAHGLAATEVAGAEVAVTIPMPGGTESLNAAVAAAIVMYEVARWRRANPLP